MAIKFQLYSSTSGWNTRHTAIKTHLGIPVGGTTKYADRVQIDNEEHEDHGKYPFPVMMDGTWKCDDQFDPDDLVEHDSSWHLPPSPPEE